MPKQKTLYYLLFLSIFLHFSTNCPAQKRQVQISAFEEQLKTVNMLKNSRPDSAYKLTTNLIELAHRQKLTSYEARLMLVSGTILYQKDRNAEAEIIFNRALALFKSIGDLAGQARVYNNLGILAREANNIPKALSFQNKGLEIRLAIKDPLLASSYNNIASIYYFQGNYPKALQYYFQGLPIAEKGQDKSLVSSILNNIGLIYWKQNRYDDALLYLQKCLLIEGQRGDYAAMAGSYNNIAGIKLDQDNHEEALRYCKEAIAYAEKINSTKELARAYNVLGELAYRKKNFREAVNYGLVGLEKRRKLGNHAEIAKSLILLGESYIEIKEFNKAQDVLNEGLQLSSSNKLLKEKESFYRLLGNMHNSQGDWQKAAQYYALRDAVKDTIFNADNSKIIFDLQTKYETEKKEAQIALLNKENKVKSLELLNNGLEIANNRSVIRQQEQELAINVLEIRNRDQLVKNQQIEAERRSEKIKNLQRQAQIQELRLAKRNTLIIAISSIALLAGLISYLLYNRYKLKQKNLLEAEVFKQQEIAAQALFDGEQQERVRIARDLHDSIGQMLSVVKMNISSMDELQDESSLASNTASLVDKTIAEVRHISHNLIPEELNFGLFNALESLCDKISKSKKTLATLHVPDSVKHYVFEKQNELGIYRIVQEVLNNMVKHAEASAININVLHKEKQLVIQIKDDGKGFNADSIHEGRGLGWKNIQARVKMLNGKLEITSEKLTGTEIEISIPQWNKQATT